MKRLLFILLLLAAPGAFAQGVSGTITMSGTVSVVPVTSTVPPAVSPVAVSDVNSHYLKYTTNPQPMTGTVTSFELQDVINSGTPFDWPGYLTYINTRGMKLIQFYDRWRFGTPTHVSTWDPQPVNRSGFSGAVYDGGNKAVLTDWNSTFWTRLASRTADLQAAGVVVMFNLYNAFDVNSANGWSTTQLNPANNSTGCTITDTNGDGKYFEVFTRPAPCTAYENAMIAYIHKVVDTLDAYDNVMYIVCTECETSTLAWQQWVMAQIRSYQTHTHLVGIGGGAANNAATGLALTALQGSGADVIFPSTTDGTAWNTAPPANSGSSPLIVLDEDHITGASLTPDVVWKQITRGYSAVNQEDSTCTAEAPGCSSADILADNNLGKAATYLGQMHAAAAAPSTTLCSTHYCLVAPGLAYMVYQPTGGVGFTVDLSAATATYNSEWYTPATNTVTAGSTVLGGGGLTAVAFSPQCGSNPCVLMLTSVQGQTPIVVASGTLDGNVGVAYSFDFVQGFTGTGITGGVPPYTCSVVSGLPPGLQLTTPSGDLDSNCVLAGTPTTAATYSFDLHVHDTFNQSVTSARGVTINTGTGPPPVAISTTALPGAKVGTAYSTTLGASGGVLPYTWSPTGSLGSSACTGLSLSSGGVISGTPTTAGTCSPASPFVTVTDSATPTPDTDQKSLSITVTASKLAITTTSLPSAVKGVVYSQTLTAVNGTLPYSWALSGGGTLASKGAYCAGLSLSTAGAITGTPTTGGGTCSFTVQVTDAVPNTVSQALSILVNMPGVRKIKK